MTADLRVKTHTTKRIFLFMTWPNPAARKLINAIGLYRWVSMSDWGEGVQIQKLPKFGSFTRSTLFRILCPQHARMDPHEARFQSRYQWDFFIRSEPNEMVFSPDGRFVAVGASQGVVILFDTTTGKALQMIQLDANVEPCSLEWISGANASHNALPLELFIGCSNGIASSLELKVDVSEVAHSQACTHFLPRQRF